MIIVFALELRNTAIVFNNFDCEFLKLSQSDT